MPLSPDRLQNLLVDFATPPRPASVAPSNKVLDQADFADFIFEGTVVRTYAWGDGARTVLLVHGWGSRAADLLAFVRPLVRAGFRVFAFDAVAHGTTPGTTTSALQIARLVSALDAAENGFDAIVAHSIGGAAVTFAVSTISPVSPGMPRPKPNKMALLAVPASLALMTRQFTDRNGLTGQQHDVFYAAVEKQYGIVIEDYQVMRIAPALTMPTLFIHDTDDREAPIGPARDIAAAMVNARFVETGGFAHAGLLTSREVIREVIGFLGQKPR